MKTAIDDLPRSESSSRLRAPTASTRSQRGAYFTNRFSRIAGGSSERGRQDAHAPNPPVGVGLRYHLALVQAVVRPAWPIIKFYARGRAAHHGGGGSQSRVDVVDVEAGPRLDRGHGAYLPQHRRGGFRVRVLARARQALRFLLRDQDVVRMMTVFRLGCGERLRPTLSGGAAGAARVECLLELVGVGQIGVGSPFADTAWSITPPNGNE